MTLSSIRTFSLFLCLIRTFFQRPFLRPISTLAKVSLRRRSVVVVEVNEREKKKKPNQKRKRENAFFSFPEKKMFFSSSKLFLPSFNDNSSYSICVQFFRDILRRVRRIFGMVLQNRLFSCIYCTIIRKVVTIKEPNQLKRTFQM